MHVTYMTMHEVGTLNENILKMHRIRNFKISKECSTELLVGHLGGRNASDFLCVFLLLLYLWVC